MSMVGATSGGADVADSGCDVAVGRHNVSLPERASMFEEAVDGVGIVVPDCDVALGPNSVLWTHDLNLFPMD